MNRDTCEKLEFLLKTSQTLITCETVEEGRLRSLVRMSAANANINFYDWSIVDGLKLGGQIVQADTADPIDCLKFMKDCREAAVFMLKDFTQHLQTPTIVRLFREVASGLLNPISSILLCAPEISLSSELSHLAVPFELSLPSKAELRTLVNSVVEGLSRVRKLKIDISETDFESLLSSMSGLTLRQSRQVLTYAILVENALDAKDIDRVLKRKTQLIQSSGVLEFYQQDNRPVELGGFKGLKDWLVTAQVAFSAEAQRLNIPAPKGILLVGIPGCGKSLCAKIIARHWKQPLVRLDAARLFDKFIGQTERNFQKATEVVESIAPCVFWIDEIEKMMSPQSDNSSDGGVGQRLFGAFLTWLQEKNEQVFLVATCNDLSKLPPELLRKGRFDEIFFVDLPNDEERLQIAEICLKSHFIDPQKIELSKIIESTSAFSGAEIEQLMNTTILKCLRDKEGLSAERINAEAKAIIPLSSSRSQDILNLRLMAKNQFRSAS